MPTHGNSISIALQVDLYHDYKVVEFVFSGH